jgi:hypothetical protein
MIFKVLLWYALIKGGIKGLKPGLPMTVSEFDRILKQFYIEPIMQQLNKPMPDFMYKPAEWREEDGYFVSR